jgi:hypothetical protein
MALGSTQPLTEMSARVISWGEGRPVRRADNLTTFMYDNLEILEPQPPGALTDCPGQCGDCFVFSFTYKSCRYLRGIYIVYYFDRKVNRYDGFGMWQGRGRRRTCTDLWWRKAFWKRPF